MITPGGWNLPFTDALKVFSASHWPGPWMCFWFHFLFFSLDATMLSAKATGGKLHYRWATWLCSCQTPLCWLCILFDTQVQRSSLSPPVMLWLCVHAEINEWKEHSRLKIHVCKGCLLTHKGESIGLRCHVKIRLVSLLHNSSAIRSLQFPLQSDCATGCGTVGLSKESNSQSQPQCFPLLSADLPRSY